MRRDRIPALAELTHDGADVLDDGQALVDRLDTWRHGPKQGDGHRFTRGGGSGEVEPSRDRAENRRAAQLADEVDGILDRLHNDLARLVQIHGLAFPTGRVRSTDTPADAAEDGWCRSCFRDDGHLRPIAYKPSAPGEPLVPYYKGLCRRCGKHEAEHGTLPPLPLLRLLHRAEDRGGRVSQADVDRALGRTG